SKRRLAPVPFQPCLPLAVAHRPAALPLFRPARPRIHSFAVATQTAAAPQAEIPKTPAASQSPAAPRRWAIRPAPPRYSGGQTVPRPPPFPLAVQEDAKYLQSA